MKHRLDGKRQNLGWLTTERKLLKMCSNCQQFSLIGNFIEVYWTKKNNEPQWWYECEKCLEDTVDEQQRSELGVLEIQKLEAEARAHTHTHNGLKDCTDYNNCSMCHCHLQDENHTACCKGAGARESYQRRQEWIKNERARS